jgi:hypothetical protein
MQMEITKMHEQENRSSLEVDKWILWLMYFYPLTSSASGSPLLFMFTFVSILSAFE